MKKGNPFESMKIGDKPDFGDNDDDETTDDGEGEGEGEEPSFAEAGAEMATRQFVKALGVDPEKVDMGKATKAMKAIVASCYPSKGE